MKICVLLLTIIALNIAYTNATNSMLQTLMRTMMPSAPQSRKLPNTDYLDDAPASRSFLLSYLPEEMQADAQKFAHFVKEVLILLQKVDIFSNSPSLIKALGVLNVVDPDPVRRTNNPGKDSVKMRKKNCG